MNLKDNLYRLNVAIVTHIYATGPAHALEKYLKGRVDSLVFIQHPFYYCQKRNSRYTRYEKGKEVRDKKTINWRLAGILYYFKDVFYTLWWLLFSPKCDLYIGVDNLNAFCGLILKRLGKIKKVIFYTIDYIPRRFRNRLLNNIYHFFDSYCVKESDCVWNLSSIMVTEREKRGVSQRYRAKQITVPIGTDLNMPPLPIREIERYTIVYMGHLLEKQGVELLIESLSSLLKNFPQIRLVIIGGGPLESQLRQRVEELGLSAYVEFTGFIEDHREIQERLRKYALGIAPYVDDEETYTRYTDPGKPKVYMATGLPVIITKVPKVAFEIEQRGAGLAINYDQGDLIRAVKRFLLDNALYEKSRQAAIQFARECSWEEIFSQAFQKIRLIL